MTTPDRPRLIEVAFPLKQASLDSVHEKNVRHGHISTLHIWPARRPLAASRAALIATLLPDPGTSEARRKLVERIGGRVVKGKDGKETTEGGILHWGRESNPDMDWFREEIRKAYGGRAPRVLDPFAGGGAIPLEAMRLGCEVTAVDINPVAWFILKCTLEYPQRLAGQTRPLPDFVRQHRAFLEAFFKARGLKGKALTAQVDRIIQGAKGTTGQLAGMEASDALPDADLAWHVRAWGAWVLGRARRDLAPYYPTVDGKPTVAYLWARTVTCKHCRATIPLLKTRWLFRIKDKRVLLTMERKPDGAGVTFGIRANVPPPIGTAAQRKEADKKLGAGTMSGSGATCPSCGVIMTKEDIQLEGTQGRVGTLLTAIAVEGTKGKDYALPTEQDLDACQEASRSLESIYEAVPFGIPFEPVTEDAKGSTWCAQYGFDSFDKLFTPRQLSAIGTLVSCVRRAAQEMNGLHYPEEWREGIAAYLALSVSRFLDYNNTNAHWKLDRATVNNSFVRFAIPLSWDFVEANPMSTSGGGYQLCYERICSALDSYASWNISAPVPTIRCDSALRPHEGSQDLVLTDPPYYDAIGYAAIMDFFYVWLRRILHGITPEIDSAFAGLVTPKWDHELADGELVDDANRFGGDKSKSKRAYEDGMARAFQTCHIALGSNGRLVIVFAHKQPDAWETLVAAIIRAGFVVDGSWPIQTEMSNRTRALSSAALSSSVWLVCRKRPVTARPGWDNIVLSEMKDNVIARLRDFWDAGIRGPDFVWAATGPALEAYSKYPVVKKANEPGQVMSVSEFLAHARRIVVEFVVGRVLGGAGGGEDEARDLDPITTYYLLHRHDFGTEPGPVGPCILYAVSCGLRDSDLAGRYDLLARGSGSAASASAVEEGDAEDVDEDGGGEGEAEESGGGSTVKLKPWNARKRVGLAADGDGRPVPLIDRTHRLMQLWRAGDVAAVDDYLDTHGLRRSPLFHHLLQALIELAPVGSEERSLLESISNHVNARAARPAVAQPALPGVDD